MNTKITISIIIIIAVVFLGFLLFRGGDGGSEEQSEKSSPTLEVSTNEDKGEVSKFDKAPNFSLEDIEGNIVSLESSPGKILVINSWATWCPFCVDELPDFGDLQAEFKDEIVIIAINRQEGIQKSVTYTDGIGITENMVYLLDPKDSFYKSIGGFSMPETIFVDADRNIRIHKRGPMELSEMIEKVNSIIN